MLISEAYAQAGAAGGDSNLIVQLLPMLLIFVVFYFLLIRPQQKKMKAHREMISNLRRGDKIVTSGGFVGTVTKVIDDSFVQVEIAEGVKTRVSRQYVAEVMSKTEPAQSEEKGSSSDSDDDK